MGRSGGWAKIASCASGDSMVAAWFTSANGAGFGVFENQDRAEVKRLIFEYFDGNRYSDIWSTSAIANAAEWWVA